MQSSLIPERPLVISPTLAATIGLEEAVMLHVMSEQLAFRVTQRQQNLDWIELTQQDLMDLMPYWAWIDVRRVLQSLQDLGLLLVNAKTGRDDSWLIAINQRNQVAASERPRAAAAPELPKRAAPGNTEGRAGYIAGDWQPDREWLALCRQHGIPESFALSLVPGFVMYWRERAQSRFSWGNVFYKHVLKEWRHEQTRRGASEFETDMAPGWRPSGEAVSILVNAGVSEAFIEDAVPEFVLYWRERGAGKGPWNTRFIEHIRRQWARFSVSLKHDGLPRPIPEDWQPSDEVFDILSLAEIDAGFAREKVPEFVLYWRDTGQALASWNTKFLQFIKFSWARRPEAAGTGVVDARDQHAAERGRQGLEATFRRFTDRSWAE
ncbi:DnaT-like ssDNA-binding domain-containing protein [Pseudohongiella spirulinae]|uniref:DnaT DNA-binding domain-containing protein n=1 Tax=Pseudohongiella spirulinae TaxID=1249552 RepID=A0A0S2KAR6_9GAMM|nr:DnaT-like ssDNA-binding domain-containing protein [Pseudohongiella spirulinae]ALO45386.1 hypothetical protein PS2015_707 [Pseudohongiella spirulinae]